MQSDDLGLVPVAWRHRGPKGGWITTEKKQPWSEQPLYDAAAMERLVAERDEAREAWQKAETALLLSDEAIQYASVTLGGPDEWSDQEAMIYSIRATAEAAEAKRDKLKEALTEISCPTQTDKLLWWQARARQALGEP